MFTSFKNSFTSRLSDKCAVSLNAWLYYFVIYHYLQYIFQIDAIFLTFIFHKAGVMEYLNTNCCKFTTESISGKFGNRLKIG